MFCVQNVVKIHYQENYKLMPTFLMENVLYTPGRVSAHYLQPTHSEPRIDHLNN